MTLTILIIFPIFAKAKACMRPVKGLASGTYEAETYI